MKVIQLSQCKNASSSITAALAQILGYKTFNWFGSKMITRKFEYNWDKIWKISKEYNILRDDPFPFIYEEIFKKYPNAKYIHTYRNSEDWFNSFYRGFATEWNGRFETKQLLYPIRFLKPELKDFFIKIYEDQNYKIINFFKDKDNFISFDISVLEKQTDKQNWEMLYTFLDKEFNKKISNTPFPKLRVNQSTL